MLSSLPTAVPVATAPAPLAASAEVGAPAASVEKVLENVEAKAIAAEAAVQVPAGTSREVLGAVSAELAQ